MNLHALRTHAIAFFAGTALLALSGPVAADPPSRVARLGYASGLVEFSPGGENDWGEATLNRTLSAGDRLWADEQSRAEIQLGGAVIRLGAQTAVTLINLDDRIAQVQLTQGVLNVRVRRLDPGQALEIDTPNLAFTLRRPGAFRIEVDPAGNATTILVRQGQGEAYGDGAAFVIDSRQAYRFTGTDLREDRFDGPPRRDEFDRWSDERERGYDNSPSARYVSPDVVGYQDLDANGTWRSDPTYGNVWYPSRVSAGWAPYRDGHWAWVDPWGWTWVDDAPWGFAVSHYGRWANLRGTWGWVPGPVRSRAYYAPALVAFVGGSNFQLTISSGNVGGIAWFPLAPREVYRPSYPVSRGYFQNVNRSNTVINNTVINNTYNQTNVTQVVYANQQVAGAVVAVPATAFVQSQPVSRSAVRVSREMMAGATVTTVAAVAPTARSVRGNAGESRKQPPRVYERPVVARTAPPPAPVGFAAQQRLLADKPGKPLDEATRRTLKPATPIAAPVVRVVPPERVATPTARPASAAQAGKGEPARSKPQTAPAEKRPEQAQQPQRAPAEKRPEQAQQPQRAPAEKRPEQAQQPQRAPAEKRPEQAQQPQRAPAEKRPEQAQQPQRAPAEKRPEQAQQPQRAPAEKRPEQAQQPQRAPAEKRPEQAQQPQRAPAEKRPEQAQQPQRAPAEQRPAQEMKPQEAKQPAPAAADGKGKGKGKADDKDKRDDKQDDKDEQKPKR